jgi:hypothetical protein
MVYSAVAYWSTENRSFWALTSTNTVTQGIEFQRRQKHYTIVPQKIQNYVTFRYFNRRSSTNIFYMTLKYLIFMFNLQNPLAQYILWCVLNLCYQELGGGKGGWWEAPYGVKILLVGVIFGACDSMHIGCSIHSNGNKREIEDDKQMKRRKPQ